MQTQKKTSASADAGTASFSHTPRPPYIPAGHQDQRHFSRIGGMLELDIGSNPNDTVLARVYRNATGNTAELRLSTWGDAHNFECSAHMRAEQLTELARQLLDAAHDLQTLPATSGGAA